MESRYGEIVRECAAHGYEAGRLIGIGATSAVYSVTQKGSEYACKVSDKKAWLEAESKLLESIEHPLFPRWKEYWNTEEDGYLVMEYLSGQNLKRVLKQSVQLPMDAAIGIALELADGLAYLHERKPAVIYKDLKPENIIIQPDGRVRLSDLGAASVPAGWRVGSPGYSAPEQLAEAAPESRGKIENLEPCQDVYALGMVLWHMLTGLDPVIEKVLDMSVQHYDRRFPVGLEDVVYRCVKRNPAERIPGMRQLMAELGNYYQKNRIQLLGQDMKSLRKIRSRRKTVFEKQIWVSDYKTDWG